MKNKFGTELGEYLEFSHISINDFAERIDTSSKNLIDIIAGKVSLSQNIIYNISFVTEIPVSYIENIERSFKFSNNIDAYLKKNNLSVKEYLQKFRPKEANKSYGIIFKNERNDYCVLEDIYKFLRVTSPEALYNKLNNPLYKSKNDKPELLALWLEKCYKNVLCQELKMYSSKNINIIVEKLKEMASNNEFNEEKIINLFNNNGIFLTFEDDLKGSKIRGSFQVLNDKPAIYITRKYHRIADIYFTIFHELAHCKSDFNRAKANSLVSFDECFEDLDYELRADMQAFNWMVDDNIYKKNKTNIDGINNLDVIKSFFVYRLAHDKLIKYSSKVYQEYNFIINHKL